MLKLPPQAQLTDYTNFGYDLLEGLNQKFSGNLNIYFGLQNMNLCVIESHNDETNLYSSIRLKYGYISFIDIPEEIVNCVIQLTNCDSYVILDNEIITCQSMISHNNICILSSVYESNLFYSVYINNEYVLCLKRNHTLQLTQVYNNASIDIVKMVFQSINEVIKCSLNGTDIHKYKSLFNNDNEWIPEKDDVFRPQFLD